MSSSPIDGRISYQKWADQTPESAAEKTQELFESTSKDLEALKTAIELNVYTQEQSNQASSSWNAREAYRLKPSKIDFFSLSQSTVPESQKEYGNAEFDHMLKTLYTIQTNVKGSWDKNDGLGAWDKYNEITWGNYKTDTISTIFTNLLNFMKSKWIDVPKSKQWKAYTNADFLYMVSLWQALVIRTAGEWRNDKSTSFNFGDCILGVQSMKDFQLLDLSSLPASSQNISQETVPTQETVETMADGSIVTHTIDGNVITKLPDGTEIHRYPDESIVEYKVDWSIIRTVVTPHRNVTVTEEPLGNIVITYPDGTKKVLEESIWEPKQSPAKLKDVGPNGIYENATWDLVLTYLNEHTIIIPQAYVQETPSMYIDNMAGIPDMRIGDRSLPKLSDVYNHSALEAQYDEQWVLVSENRMNEFLFTFDDLRSRWIKNMEYIPMMYATIGLSIDIADPNEKDELVQSVVKLWMQQLDVTISQLKSGLSVRVNNETVPFVLTPEQIKQAISVPNSELGDQVINRWRFIKHISLSDWTSYDLIFDTWTDSMKRMNKSVLPLSNRKGELKEKFVIQPVGLQYAGIKSGLLENTAKDIESIRINWWDLLYVRQ